MRSRNMGSKTTSLQLPTQSTRESIIESRRNYACIFEENTLPNLFRKLCYEHHGLETDRVFQLLSFVDMIDDIDEETKVHVINLLPTLPALAQQDDNGVWKLNPGSRELGRRLDLEGTDMDGVVDGKIMRILRGRVSCGLTVPVMTTSADGHEEHWRELITWISGSMHMLVLSIMGKGDVDAGADMVGLSGISSDI